MLAETCGAPEVSPVPLSPAGTAAAGASSAFLLPQHWGLAALKENPLLTTCQCYIPPQSHFYEGGWELGAASQQTGSFVAVQKTRRVGTLPALKCSTPGWVIYPLTQGQRPPGCSVPVRLLRRTARTKATFRHPSLGSTYVLISLQCSSSVPPKITFILLQNIRKPQQGGRGEGRGGQGAATHCWIPAFPPFHLFQGGHEAAVRTDTSTHPLSDAKPRSPLAEASWERGTAAACSPFAGLLADQRALCCTSTHHRVLALEKNVCFWFSFSLLKSGSARTRST